MAVATPLSATYGSRTRAPGLTGRCPFRWTNAAWCGGSVVKLPSSPVREEDQHVRPGRGAEASASPASRYQVEGMRVTGDPSMRLAVSGHAQCVPWGSNPVRRLKRAEPHLLGVRRMKGNPGGAADAPRATQSAEQESNLRCPKTGGLQPPCAPCAPTGDGDRWSPSLALFRCQESVGGR